MRLISLLLPAVLWAARLNGQIPVGPEPVDTVSDAESADTGTALDESAQKVPWRTSYFPYITGGTNDGPVLAFRVHHFQPAEYDARVTTNAAFTAALEGLASQRACRCSPGSALRILWPRQRDGQRR